MFLWFFFFFLRVEEELFFFSRSLFSPFRSAAIIEKTLSPANKHAVRLIGLELLLHFISDLRTPT
jgi:hypothetical protein